MVRQIRLLDPSISCEIGTPERKIIDTIAQELANAQIDLNQLDSAFDLESKFGSDLDEFLSIFSFYRQSGSQATGYVTFSRVVTSAFPVPIPQGTQITAPSIATDGASISLTFATTAYGEIPVEGTEVTIPVRCLNAGAVGNIAANTITAFARSPVLGVTSVTNTIPTSGGSNVETDPALKVRFKNTVFRNLAGTEDQYLALAVATAFTTKANAVGPISRYQEYIQVPDVDDASNDPDSGFSGNGNAGEWTTALSTIPYSKFTYENLPYYLTSEATSAPTSVFFREEVDFRMNTTNEARDKGDTFRGREEEEAASNVYTNPGTKFQPNLTLFNVYTGENTEVVAFHPKDILLFEHAYMSDASRNDWEHQILNCVDVFINGSNPVQADAVTVKPSSSYATINAFSTNPLNRFYIENFRRIGTSETRPVIGNFFMPLYWTPILTLPPSIVTATATYIENIHYWPIEDVSEIGRSVRARTGIEWSTSVLGQLSGDATPEQYSGPIITADTATALEVTGYTYDRNIVDLQSTLEANKNITSDVLGHQSKTRYFKLDITVMYEQGFSTTAINNQIKTAVENYFGGSYFGTTIQLSDLLQSIHNISGVDNVRWSREIVEKSGKTEESHKVDSSGNLRARVVECDAEGHPLCNFVIQRQTYGHTGVKEVQIGYFTGAPEAGHFTLTQGSLTTAKIAQTATVTEIRSALTTAGIAVEVITGAGTPSNPYIFTFSTTGYNTPMTATSYLFPSSQINETTAFETDFFLKDDELPALPTGSLPTDTLPGLIIRKRAQNTWQAL
jgi:uncharacterized phage protein gp47/JayE